MSELCGKICDEIEEQVDPGTIEDWKAMKRGWEGDLTKPDPYELIEKRESHSPPPC